MESEQHYLIESRQHEDGDWSEFIADGPLPYDQAVAVWHNAEQQTPSKGGRQRCVRAGDDPRVLAILALELVG